MIGPIGIWTFALDMLPVGEAREAAAELEDLGYAAIWLPEAVGRDPIVHAALLLDATERITLATGIASIWARDHQSMVAAQKTVDAAHPGRFLLGLGVSHQPFVEGVRGKAYERPFSAMSAYLDGMDKALFFANANDTMPPRVLAALGPKMLGLARDRADGAHPYLAPPENTARSREILGDDRLLCPEQPVVLSSAAEHARTLARRHLSTYLSLPNYTNNLKRLGFTDDDIGGGGSDRLVDTIVCWGDVDAIKRRVDEHRDAGADHVCVQVIPETMRDTPRDAWRELAPALLA